MEVGRVTEGAVLEVRGSRGLGLMPDVVQWDRRARWLGGEFQG